MTAGKFVVTVIFNINPQHLDNFRSAIVENAALSVRNETGCLHFDVCEDATQPRFFLYEIYDDAAAFDAHLETSHFKHFNVLTADWVRDKTISRYMKLPTAI